MHTTNYSNTFIAVAADCPVETGVVPPEKVQPTVAFLQYSLLAAHPYRYTSDELLLAVHVSRKGIPDEEVEAQREQMFARGQACLRSSPLAKRYGWGIHHDNESRVALYACDSDDYRRLSADSALKQTRAMKSAR